MKPSCVDALGVLTYTTDNGPILDVILLLKGYVHGYE